jgi:protein-tyrosine phosphatase
MRLVLRSMKLNESVALGPFKMAWAQYSIIIFGVLGSLCLSGCTTARPLNITEIAPGVFDGRKPRSKADFDTLTAKGIRTIVSLQTMTWDVAPERKLAAQHGIGFTNIPIGASLFGPSQRKVQQLFQVANAASLQPVYIHCLLGRDRTGALMALYRVYYQNADPKVAWEEMIRHGGFRSRWALIGFRIFYLRHCEKPAWAMRSDPAAGGAPPIATTNLPSQTGKQFVRKPRNGIALPRNESQETRQPLALMNRGNSKE